MKAALLHEFKGIEKIYIEEIPTPTPKPHEVLIKVHAAGINPVDWKIAEGMLKTRVEYHFPIIPGWDVAGSVAAVGANVTHLKEGDPVFAFTFDGELIHTGTYAEYVCLDATYALPKPPALSMEEAAAIPLSALTAYQAINHEIAPKQGDQILIQGGAGCVGGFAIQFAKLRDAYVIATTSTKNLDYVSALGADEVIDYTAAPFDKQLLNTHPEQCDSLLDCVGGPHLAHCYPLVKPGGLLLSIAGVITPNLAKKHGNEVRWYMLHRSAEDLSQIGQLINTSALQLPHIEVVPFDDFESALHRSREGHVRGKLVLQIA